MHRRRFVQLALGSVALSAIAGVSACRDPGACELVSGADAAWAGLSRSGRAKALAEATFGARIEDARLLGEAYATTPGADEALEAFRCAHIEGQPDLQSALNSVNAAIEAEFAARDIVNVQGWVLAPTELVRCMLA